MAMKMPTVHLKSCVPEGSKGPWSVSKYVVTEDGAKFDFLRGMFHGGRYTPAGTYTKLTCNGHIVMSDTPDELSDFGEFVWKAYGSVLVNGLGLGCVVQALLAKPEVTDVTVVEISQDVIDLVHPTLAEPRLTVICADAYEWKPPKGRRWDFVWHDVWPNLCTDNLSLMGKLHRRGISTSLRFLPVGARRRNAHERSRTNRARRSRHGRGAKRRVSANHERQASSEPRMRDLSQVDSHVIASTAGGVGIKIRGDVRCCRLRGLGNVGLVGDGEESMDAETETVRTERRRREILEEQHKWAYEEHEFWPIRVFAPKLTRLNGDWLFILGDMATGDHIYGRGRTVEFAAKDFCNSVKLERW